MSTDHSIDTLARDLHARALGHASLATRTRLRADRARVQQQALPRRAPRSNRWLALGSITLTTLLAIGLNQGLEPGTTDTPALQAISLPLDENPDLYLWLASEPLLAME
jgi:hypothetical protein